MADLSISITDSVNCFGFAPSTKWGVGSPYSATWGVSKWGEGTEDLITAVDKVLGGTISETDMLYLSYGKTISDTPVSVSTSIDSLTLRDASGWDYIAPGGGTQWEDQIETSYSDNSDPSTAWTAGSDPSTSWS